MAGRFTLAQIRAYTYTDRDAWWTVWFGAWPDPQQVLRAPSHELAAR